MSFVANVLKECCEDSGQNSTGGGDESGEDGIRHTHSRRRTFQFRFSSRRRHRRRRRLNEPEPNLNRICWLGSSLAGMVFSITNEKTQNLCTTIGRKSQQNISAASVPSGADRRGVTVPEKDVESFFELDQLPIANRALFQFHYPLRTRPARRRS
jgi:hypothetical protein